MRYERLWTSHETRGSPNSSGSGKATQEGTCSPLMYASALTGASADAQIVAVGPTVVRGILESGKRCPVNRVAFESGADMKSLLVLSILAALLGGGIVAPGGYHNGRDGYYQDHGYDRNDDRNQNRNYNRGDGNSRDYDHRRDYSNPSDPYKEHGS